MKLIIRRWNEWEKEKNDLPNAVNISPPCCLVKLTTRIVGESTDDDGGNTNDVGIGPARHVGTIDIPKMLTNMRYANESIEMCCDLIARSDFRVNDAIFFNWYMVRLQRLSQI